MPLTITAVDVGVLTQCERSGHQYLTGCGEKVDAQIVVWLIQGGPFPVLVDLGAGTTSDVEQFQGRTLIQSRPLADALREVGVRKEDVGAIVQTHLHWDHCLGMEYESFPNAAVFVQGAEVRYAAAPYPVHVGGYNSRTLAAFQPTSGHALRNLRVMEGDFRLFDGVDVLLMPGHTPGLQAVVVETDEGRYGIASDNVPWQSSWQGRDPRDWIPSGIHVSLADCYESMARLARVADHVLPSHDPCVLEGGGLFPRAGQVSGVANLH